MPLAFLIVAQVLIASGAVAMAVLAFRIRRASHGGTWLVVMAAAVAEWSLVAVAEATLTGTVEKTVASQLQWIGTMLCPLAYLMLVGDYTGSRWLRHRVGRAVVLGIAGVAFLVVSTNALHHLVWDGYLGGTGTGVGFLEPNWQIAFPVMTGFGYVYALVGLNVLTRAMLRAPAAYRGTFVVVVSAAALPFIVSAVFFIGSAGLGTVMITGAFLVSTAAMAWSIHRFPVLVQRDGFLRAARETIVEVIDEGVLVIDSEGVVVDANRAASRLLGIGGPIVGRPSTSVLVGWPQALATAGVSGRHEGRVVEPRSGLVLDVLTSSLPGPDLRTDRVVIMRDGTARAAAEAQLEHVAHHDPLTDLPNRRALRLALADAVADGPATLLLLDLDGFKEVNDTYGHGCGDDLLVEVAARVRELLPAGAFAARLGGDEFAVILPQASLDEAAELARRLAARLGEPVHVGAIHLRVTASVGVARAPEHAGDPAGLERCADVAMYQAKRSRRVVAPYDPSLDPNTPERLALLAELPRAVAGGELVIHLQPLVRVDTGEPIGAEALVRWAHPRLGLLPPGAFLPLVEPAGIGRALVREVARQAVAALRDWPTYATPLQIGINVSAIDLGDAALVDDILALIRDAGLDPGTVVLELTEDALLDDPDAVAHIRRARAAGLRLALDDFGTGFGSMSLLRDVEGATVKVARTFIHRLADSPVDQAVLRGIVDVASYLGYWVVAEGVEDERTLRACAELGCRIAQGFHIARPMPVDDCARWLAAQAARGAAAD